MASPQTGSRASLSWVLFSIKGRISRQIYWLAWGLLVCVNGVLVGQLVGGDDATLYRIAELVGPLVILATVYANFAVAVKRLHDVGYAGFIAIALFVPLVNIGFTIWVGLLPGSQGPNAYGEAADRIPA